MTQSDSSRQKPSLTALEALEARVTTLEAERAVRKTIARYMGLCDVPSVSGNGASLEALFADDAIWEGIGPHYAQKFGCLHGRAEIVAMLQRYLPPTPHFATNVHFLTAETIEVVGASAKGRWVMLQASGYVDGKATLISARLEVDFSPASDGGQWLIQHFRTERLFDAPWQINPCNDTTS